MGRERYMQGLDDYTCYMLSSPDPNFFFGSSFGAQNKKRQDVRGLMELIMKIYNSLQLAVCLLFRRVLFIKFHLHSGE